MHITAWASCTGENSSKYFAESISILCFFLHLCTLLRARCNITLLLPWTPPTQIQPRVVKSKPSQSFVNSPPFKFFTHQQQTTPWRPQQRHKKLQKNALDCFVRQVCQSASLNAAHAGPDQWSRPPRSVLNPSSLCPFEGEVIYRVPPDPEKQWWAVIDWILQHSWGLAFIPTPMGENWSLLRMEIIDPWWEWMSEITNDLINNEDPLFPDHMWRRHQSRHCWLRIILENQNIWIEGWLEIRSITRSRSTGHLESEQNQ